MVTRCIVADNGVVQTVPQGMEASRCATPATEEVVLCRAFQRRSIVLRHYWRTINWLSEATAPSGCSYLTVFPRRSVQSVHVSSLLMVASATQLRHVSWLPMQTKHQPAALSSDGVRLIRHVAYAALVAVTLASRGIAPFRWFRRVTSVAPRVAGASSSELLT